MTADALAAFVGKTVFLRWQDAHDSPGWNDLAEPPQPRVMRQYGVFHEIANGYARIVYSYDDVGGEASFTDIPLGMIEDVHELRPYRPRKRKPAAG